MTNKNPAYRIEKPVFDLGGNVLLSAETEISRTVMQAMIESRTGQPAMLSMMAYQTVRKDLVDFLESPPYREIFSAERKRRVVAVAEKAVMPEPILAILYHFRHVDFYTYRHTILVFALSILLADRLIGDRDIFREGVVAGPTHDIGKLCVPVSILTKTDPLTESEMAYLRHHAAAGYVLLSYFYGDSEMIAARVARDHHERKDGSGYPAGTVIDDTMIDVIVVSDIYDALISPRPYRPVSFSNRSALDELTDQAEKGSIRLEAVKTLIALNRSSETGGRDCRISQERREDPPELNFYGVSEPDC